MDEWRLIAVSRFRIEVIVVSHGMPASYIPNCTRQGAVAACARFSDTTAATAPSESADASSTHAEAMRKDRPDMKPPGRLWPPNNPGGDTPRLANRSRAETGCGYFLWPKTANHVRRAQ